MSDSADDRVVRVARRAYQIVKSMDKGPLNYDTLWPTVLRTLSGRGLHSEQHEQELMELGRDARTMETAGRYILRTHDDAHAFRAAELLKDLALRLRLESIGRGGEDRKSTPP